MDGNTAPGAAANLKYPLLRIVRFSGDALTAGVETHQIEGRRLRVYGVAKRVADCFNYRNKVGLAPRGLAGATLRRAGAIRSGLSRQQRDAPVPRVARAITTLALYRYRDKESVASKGVALLRHGFGGHQLHRQPNTTSREYPAGRTIGPEEPPLQSLLLCLPGLSPPAHHKERPNFETTPVDTAPWFRVYVAGGGESMGLTIRSPRG